MPVPVRDELGFPLFGPLEAEVRAAIAPLLHPRRYEAGRLIFQRGDRAEEAFVITAGQVRISVCSADGREVAFRVAGPGETVGEIGALDHSRRSADMTALRPTEMLVLARADLLRLIGAHPALALAAIRFLCLRLRETSGQLEALALQRVEARLARFLLGLLNSSFSARKESELMLGMSQSEIGGLIGASRPKVNIAFALLEEQGAIRRDGKRLYCRVAALAGQPDG